MPVNPYTVGKKQKQSTFERCARVAGMGFGFGGGIGVAIGAMWGIPQALALRKVDTFGRVRFVARACIQTGVPFGVFLAAGFLMRGC
mmetsp:Transcript_22289/g.43351  ORF Transcript_22289/g.43351 Transcript_22289/m.43351 type:complete len:87 (-) Transcript_22289:301-561(-)